jgi:N-acetyl sugar amidotransferase
MQICARCLYPANHPLGITFDREGVCSGCRIHEEKDSLDWTQREQELRKILNGYRGRTRGRHDCVIPISGGRDSFYIVHLARVIYGLNPLLVTYNRHYNSRAGIYNVARLRTVFGCDIVTLTLDPALVRRVMRASLALRGSFHWHALAGQTVFPVQTAVRMKIPLVIWGAHQGLEQVGMYSHLDEVEMTRRYRREHDLMSLEAEDMVGAEGVTESDLTPFFYPEDSDLLRVNVRGIYLGNYVRWDTKVQHEQMVRLYNYYQGPLARTFDNYNDVDDLHYAGMHDLIKQRKFGFGKALDHACREIRFGRLTREQGAKLVAEYEGRSAPDSSKLSDFIKLGEREILAFADRHRSAGVSTDSIVTGLLNGTPIGNASCVFGTRTPDDFEGPADEYQLLTRGFARE